MRARISGTSVSMRFAAVLTGFASFLLMDVITPLLFLYSAAAQTKTPSREVASHVLIAETTLALDVKPAFLYVDASSTEALSDRSGRRREGPTLFWLRRPRGGGGERRRPSMTEIG